MSPEQNVAVKKVVVQLGKKELILDIEDALQLRDVLNDLFGKAVVEHHHHGYPYPVPAPYWNQPLITWTSAGGNGFKYADGTVLCSTHGSLPNPSQPELISLEVR